MSDPTDRSIAPPPKWPKLLHDMRRASALCDEMLGPGDYATRMIALALITRQFLRELPQETTEP